MDSTILHNTYCQDFIKKRNCSFIILLLVCRQCLWIQALKLIRFRQLSLGFSFLIIAGIGFELKTLIWRGTELLAQKSLCPFNNHNMENWLKLKIKSFKIPPEVFPTLNSRDRHFELWYKTSEVQKLLILPLTLAWSLTFGQINTQPEIFYISLRKSQSS